MIELAGRTLTRTTAPRVAVPPWQRGVGLLRQGPGLFPHLSVRDNLAYAGTAGGGAELTSLALALGIGDLLTAMPSSAVRRSAASRRPWPAAARPLRRAAAR